MCHERTGCAKRWPWEFNGPGRVAPSCFHLLETVLGVCVCLFGGFFAKSTRGGQQVRHRNCIEHWTVVNKKEITCADQMPHFWSAPILGWSPTGDGSESHGRCSTTDPRPVFSHSDTQMVSDKTGLFCKPFHSPIFSSLCSVTDYYLYYFFLALSLTISLLLFNPLYSLWNIGQTVCLHITSCALWKLFWRLGQQLSVYPWKIASISAWGILFFAFLGLNCATEDLRKRQLLFRKVK